jgi:dTDP-4-amino-4,6-dideoxygalactose transaminase
VSTIPPLDLKRQYQTIGAEVDAAVLSVLASGAYIGGPGVQAFEQEFAKYVGTADAVGCNSGTDALYLALKILGIGAGDEVITTPFTFIATAEMISATGAKPVLVDIDPDTYNIDLNKIAAAITPQTKAIMPVHLFGRPVDMTALMSIANAHNLKVIEDCAQSASAEWAGQKTGSIGHVGCFSFFPTKNLGCCGDGGAITLNDPTWAADARMHREHGSRMRYYHEVIGINSRLDALQAAILSIKLRYLDKWTAARQEVADRYQQLLTHIPDIILPKPTPTQGKSAWNQYTLRILGGTDGSRRDAVRAKLQEVGIISMIYYPLPLHLQEVYQDLGYKPGDFPVTEEVSHQVLSIPMFPEITAVEQERVAAALNAALLWVDGK